MRYPAKSPKKNHQGSRAEIWDRFFTWMDELGFAFLCESQPRDRTVGFERLPRPDHVRAEDHELRLGPGGCVRSRGFFWKEAVSFEPSTRLF